MVPYGHPLSAVKNEFNAILFTGSTNDTLEFYGKGAGSIPTATAIVSDLVSILENRAYIDYKNENKLVVNKKPNASAKYYVIDNLDKVSIRMDMTDEELHNAKFYARIL
jgi:homoserine dehydrogenase